MRFMFLASVAALLPIQAQATTIYTGTLTPTNGQTEITSDLFGPIGYTALPAGKQQAFILELNGGSITDAYLNVHYDYDWRAYEDHYPLGNDVLENDAYVDDGCEFSGTCGVLAPWGDIVGKPYSPLSLAVFNQSAVWSISNPADFDTCGTKGTPGCYGEIFHTATLNYSFQISSNRPVSYRLTISDPLGGSNAVPEPASWVMMIAGFGILGGAMRKRNYKAGRLTAQLT